MQMFLSLKCSHTSLCTATEGDCCELGEQMGGSIPKHSTQENSIQLVITATFLLPHLTHLPLFLVTTSATLTTEEV